MGGFLESYAVSGPQFYPHCFNVEITGSGTTIPDGQTFPGLYNPKEIGLNFVPYTGSGSGVQQNSKYVSMQRGQMLSETIKLSSLNRSFQGPNCTKADLMLQVVQFQWLKRPELTVAI
jgi:hypothetical protein